MCQVCMSSARQGGESRSFTLTSATWLCTILTCSCSEDACHTNTPSELDAVQRRVRSDASMKCLTHHLLVPCRLEAPGAQAPGDQGLAAASAPTEVDLGSYGDAYTAVDVDDAYCGALHTRPLAAHPCGQCEVAADHNNGCDLPFDESGSAHTGPATFDSMDPPGRAQVAAQPIDSTSRPPGLCYNDHQCVGSSICHDNRCICRAGADSDALWCRPHCLHQARRTAPTAADVVACGCCTSEVFSSDGACCPWAGARRPTLDKHGKCCDAGYLDACGHCGGRAQLVDRHGSCCEVRTGAM